ncbi:MAG TPA: hypothetical protein VFR48_01820 [Solirubrobacteraceae bacterium]|nr:hypothetical protein [Solirubrobacteraceae bacterium]
MARRALVKNKSYLTIAIMTTLLVPLGACSGDTTGKSSSSSAAAALIREYTRIDSDRDNDVGAPQDDTSTAAELSPGQPPPSGEARAIATLLHRYYTAALADNGTAACSMIASSLAESMAEDYGRGSDGPSYLSTGTTCQSVMTLLFEHLHPVLALEAPRLEVAQLRLVRHHGIAILRFGTALERQLPVRREGGQWRVQALLDSDLP